MADMEIGSRTVQAVVPPTEGITGTVAETPVYTTGHGPAGVSVAQSPFELGPSAPRNVVGLAEALTMLLRSGNARAIVDHVVGQFTAFTGKSLTVDDATLERIAENPHVLLNMLKLTPAEMSDGFRVLGERAKAEAATTPANPGWVAPNGFDLADLDDAPVTVPQPEVKEVREGVGLYQGDGAHGTSPVQAKRRIAMAKVLNRLAANRPGDEPFSVVYEGKAFTQIDDLFEALEAGGYKVTASIQHRVANFANLKLPVPDSNPPAFIHVAVPLPIDTRFKDMGNNSAVEPAAHSELIFHVEGPEEDSPFSMELKWYQGVSDTGFHPMALWESPEWLGLQVTHRFEGPDVQRAARLSALLGDIINVAADSQEMDNGGYGRIGVCNDSVAVILHALNGEVDKYPLLMVDDMLLDYVDTALAEARKSAEGGDNRSVQLVEDLEALLESIKAVPNDQTWNHTQKERALRSLPWNPGQEVLQSAVDARRILSQPGLGWIPKR